MTCSAMHWKGCLNSFRGPGPPDGAHPGTKMHQKPGHMPGEGDFREDILREPHVRRDTAARTVLSAGQRHRKHRTKCTLASNTQICSESIRMSCAMAGLCHLLSPKSSDSQRIPVFGPARRIFENTRSEVVVSGCLTNRPERRKNWACDPQGSSGWENPPCHYTQFSQVFPL